MGPVNSQHSMIQCLKPSWTPFPAQIWIFAVTSSSSINVSAIPHRRFPAFRDSRRKGLSFDILCRCSRAGRPATRMDMKWNSHCFSFSVWAIVNSEDSFCRNAISGSWGTKKKGRHSRHDDAHSIHVVWWKTLPYWQPDQGYWISTVSSRHWYSSIARRRIWKGLCASCCTTFAALCHTVAVLFYNLWLSLAQISIWIRVYLRQKKN